jgi:hypothetical protein
MPPTGGCRNRRSETFVPMRVRYWPVADPPSIKLSSREAKRPSGERACEGGLLRACSAARDNGRRCPRIFTQGGSAASRYLVASDTTVALAGDRLPARVPPAGRTAVADVPGAVPARPAEGVDAGNLNFFAGHRHSHEPAAFRRYRARKLVPGRAAPDASQVAPLARDEAHAATSTSSAVCSHRSV